VCLESLSLSKTKPALFFFEQHGAVVSFDNDCLTRCADENGRIILKVGERRGLTSLVGGSMYQVVSPCRKTQDSYINYLILRTGHMQKS